MKHIYLTLLLILIVFHVGFLSRLMADDESTSKQFDYATYKVIFEKNMFSKDRRTPQDRVRPVERRRTVVLALYVLRGIAYDGSVKTAFIEEEVSGSGQTVGIGDSFLDGIITDITATYVVYDKNGEVINVAIGQEFGSSRTEETLYDDADVASSDQVKETVTPEQQDDVLKMMLERRQLELGK